MQEVMLRVDRVAHRFDYPLFEEVSFSLGRGESMAVVGRSGSGKSTLLHIASGFLRPQKGEVFLHGQPFYGLSESALERIRRTDIGIVFQSHYLFKGMSGRENIEAACMLAGTAIDPWLLEALEIDKVVDQPVGELSGGQRQRVSIARVLAKRPRLVFADEPTGNLDAQTASLVMDVLFAYVEKEDAALMMVTHDEALAWRCGRVCRLGDQQLAEVYRDDKPV